MDVGRTCGRAKVRFFRNSDIETVIRWYRAPHGANVFPGLSMFGLGYWAFDKLTTPGVGQVAPHNLTYDKGNTPPTAFGRGFCGSVEQYRDGLVFPPTGPPVLYDQYGMATCCIGAGPPVPPIPPVPDDDVRDINYWRQVQGNLIDVWYTGGSVTGQGQAPVAADPDTIHALPFFASRGGSLSQLGVWLEAQGSTGATVRLAIYQAASDSDLRPLTLIADSGDLPADAGGNQWLSAPISVALDHTKLYWLCVWCNNNPVMPVVGAMTSVFYFNLLGFSATSFTPYFGFKVPMPYGPYPANLPALDNTALANDSIMAAGVKYSI